MPETEPTIQDVLNAINDYATHNDSMWAKNEEQWAKNEERWQRAEALMVTKDYLDEKLGDLKGDLVVMMRKEDDKVKALITLLQKKKVISEEDAKSLLTMQPFPQLLL